jgi:AcrR family transcriptional regulator
VLYHHFRSKEALLEAAFEAVEIDVTNKVLSSRSQRERGDRGGASRL